MGLGTRLGHSLHVIEFRIGMFHTLYCMRRADCDMMERTDKLNVEHVSVGLTDAYSINQLI